jgi:arylsulfatase A-like enzyme
MRGGAHRMQLYLQENYGRRFEEDWSVARVFRNAVNWLHENYTRDDLLLWIDSFSPHEPYDPPAYYEELYDPGYTGERVIFPNYGSIDYLSEAELRHVQAMYAGTVTMADRWFGYLLDAVTAMGMLDDTMIIVTSDHGHLLGDHGMIGKPGIRQDPNGLLWHGIGDIPLIIYHPRGGKGMRESVLTGAVDLFATIMEHMGVAYPEHVDSESLLPIITGTPAGSSMNGRRELLLYARHGETVNVTDGRFTLFLHHPERHAGHTRMFDIQEDPHQNRNILGDYRARAKELKEYAGQYLRSVDATPAMRETAEQATLG